MRFSPDLGTPHLKHFSRRLKFWTPHCEAQARPSERVGLSMAPPKIGSGEPPPQGTQPRPREGRFQSQGQLGTLVFWLSFSGL